MITPPVPPEEIPSGMLSGGGEMGKRIRAHDWSRTPLGPMESWPPVLRSTLGTCLDCGFQVALYWGPELTLLYNDAWSSIPGEKHPWALGRPGKEVWPEIWDVVGPHFAQVMGGGGPVARRDDLLLMFRHGFTEECFFDFTLSPVHDESGAVAGVFNIGIETTARVLGERRLRLLRDLAAIGGDVHSVAEAARRTVATLAENPGDVAFALLYLVEAGGAAATLAAAGGVERGHPAAPERLAVDGATRPWPLDPTGLREITDLAGLELPGGAWPETPRRAVVLPLRQAGTVAGYLVIGISPRLTFDDDYRSTVTMIADAVATALERGRAEAEELRRTEELAALDRAKTAFFSNVSHEFRTPLTLLLGPVQDMLAKPEGGVLPENRVALELVHRNALRLQKLVNTLLDFSRIEAGRQRGAFAPVDLAEFTADLASTFRSALERVGLHFVVECPPLPESVWIDREAWEKVVLNLLSNAFKFTLAGGVRVTLRAEDGHAVLRVRDSGVGIPAGELGHVFERFQRIEGQRGRSVEGTGIGLALVRELVQMHDGTIAVESVAEAEAAGREPGTQFIVRLPFGRAHLPADATDGTASNATALHASHFVGEVERWGVVAPEGAPTPEAPATSRTAGARIVLADDNADMRGYAARLLAAAGYAIETVSDGEAALAVVRERRPDLIISDVMMPRLDGLGLLAALRADPALRTLPVILLSARAGEEARLEGLAAGADDYLLKPFNGRELLATIRARLEIEQVRQETEKRVRASRDLFRQMANTAPAMLWITEPDGACSFLSRSWYEHTGQTEAEALGIGWSDAVHPDDREMTARIFTEANERRAAFTLDYRLRTADGTYRWAVDSGRPRFGEGGEFLGMIGSVIDIHERKLAEATSQQAREFLQGTIDALSSHIAVLDADAVILAVNAAWRRFADENDLAHTDYGVGTAYTAVLDEQTGNECDEAAAASGIRAVIEGKLPRFVLEYPCHAPHEQRWYQMSVTRFHTTGPVRVVVAHENITARVLANQALREADRRKDEFLAMLAHELRNPLASVTHAAALLRGGPTEADRDWAAEVIERQSGQLARLVDDLLDVARITRGKIDLRRVRLDAATALERACETAAPQMAARNHTLHAEFRPGELWLDADPTRLEQIVVNLLTNAARYTPANGRIWLEARRDGGEIVIVVRDTGIGIPPGRIGEIFDLFTQGERSADRAEGGLGIGLTVVRGLCELHGGSVSAFSEGAGKGSTFTVRLPAARAPKLTADASRGSSSETSAASGTRILIVDDNADTANGLARLLGRRGYLPEVVHAGPAALERAATFLPAIVLLDIGLPGMDGYEVVRRLRAEPFGRHALILALSGYGQEEDRARAREAGFDQHLVKPVAIEDLLAVLAARRG